MTKTAIKIDNLAKTYFLYHKPSDRLKQFFVRWKPCFVPFDALRPTSITINKGETVGIVGRNGSGKSTLLQMVCGTLNPTSGSVDVNGRVSALLELGAGFNPEFSGKDNIYLNAMLLGMSKEEVAAKYDDIVKFSGIGSLHIAQPVKTYSSGMYVRLAFAVAAATDPDILIVDEALAVGDVAFQRKCFARLREMQDNGATILFVSHAHNTVQELCDRVILMDAGEVLLDGEPKAVLAQYNRMMSAPENRQQAVRKEIIQMQENIPEEMVDFDSGMQPESTVEYEKQGAEITNPRITTKDGKEVNILQRGETYIYTYEVDFSEAAEKVRFGMNIKTKSGVVLGGASTHTEKKPIAKVKVGGKKKVKFIFRCALLPGTYFTNAGCSAVVGGERIVIHRILDACMFRVEDEPSIKATGIVDFSVKSEVV